MKRFGYTVAILVLFAIGIFWSYDASRLYVLHEGRSGSETYQMLFNTKWLLLPLAILAGIFMGARNGVHEEKIENGKILRHDEDMFIMHWGQAIGTLALMFTGTALGTLFIPSSVVKPETIGFFMNIHFVAALFFLFGVTFYITKGLLTGELKEMMPRKGDLKGMIEHYVCMIKRQPMPQEEKYLHAERVVFPGWIISVGLIIITGVMKVMEHFIDLPGGFMSFMTALHGVGMLLMMLMLVGHVFAGAIIPASWPLIRSMITGYVSESYVRSHHGKWLEKIEKDETKINLEEVKEA